MADNGFCVLRIKARSHRDLVTVVGHAAMVSAGEWITASGEWINDRTHGQQFKARFMRTSEPSSIEGIEKYLGSGMIRGIGPVYAGKMVRAFGEKVFDIIEAEPERLREVTGIGRVRAKRITDAWAEQKVIREIMVFLHSHGVGTACAVRIVCCTNLHRSRTTAQGIKAARNTRYSSSNRTAANVSNPSRSRIADSCRALLRRLRAPPLDLIPQAASVPGGKSFLRIRRLLPGEGGAEQEFGEIPCRIVLVPGQPRGAAALP